MLQHYCYDYDSDYDSDYSVAAAQTNRRLLPFAIANVGSALCVARAARPRSLGLGGVVDRREVAPWS